MKISYWLFKSESDVYSIDNMKKDKVTFWNGVRNYQARNYLRDDMKNGDRVLFYHSNSEPTGVFGICEIVKEGYPDFTAMDSKSEYYDIKSTNENPVWFMVDIKFVMKFDQPVTLSDIRMNPKLNNMKLLQKGNRLSVMPIEKFEFDEIIKMAG